MTTPAASTPDISFPIVVGSRFGILIAKLETDPDMRARAGKIISNVMTVVFLAAAVVVGYLSLNI